ncbi:MAG: LpxI family protein [Rickettsia endosymbiont of Oxypoda opaca]|nr:LpxI family protein [Rickettsia endosymbiont of Oxypoda opaca]
MLTKIGIIAGKGALPYLTANNYTKQGGKCYIAAIKGEADTDLIKDFEYKVFKIGMVGEVIHYFKKHNVQNLIFIGGVNRPNFSNLAVDRIGGLLLFRIIGQKILGDDKVLRIIANFFEGYGFKVISNNDIYKNQKYYVYNTTNTLPSDSDERDIELGIKLLNHLSKLDVGQSVIIEDKYVLGIEAAEGTDNLIIRCASLRKKPKGGVLVKIPKLGQDIRLDIPAIGPDTILNLAKYNYNGIAIKANDVIIVEQELTVKLANERKIFMVKC